MPSLTLTRLTGFDRNKKASLDKNSVALGTDAGSDLRFDPTWDKTVSARHATLEYHGGAWWLKDSSKDGTFVGGRKVTQEKLNPGDVIELGRGGPKVQVDFAAAVAPAPAPAAQAARQAPSAPPPPVSTPPPMPAAAPSVAKPAPKSGGSGPLIAVALAAVVILLGAGAWVFRDKLGFGPAPETALAEMAKEYSEAVGLVVVSSPKGPEGFGTAWAIAPGIYATNSHVSQPIAELLKNSGSAYIAVNRRPDLRLKITRAVVHPRYGKEETNFEGKKQPVLSYDVGLLYVQGEAPKVFRPARKPELEKLDSGYRIGFLGFPMEGMAGNNVDVRNPVATMQSGIVTATTDYWLAPAPFERRFSVQHNLGATGGASGSPMFNSRGEVVAILNAGNIIGTISRDGNVVRAPSAVMVNYAQRVDLLRDIWPDYPKD
ncbi:MAG: FHA domain-containing protein [Opitutaceae bacterium]|nr:FHA domain-containing protein [Opitutaceae bacterium]